MNRTLKIGTRGSRLALVQADWVKSAVLKIRPSCTVELVVIKTKGDKILDVPLAQVGGKGLFVKEIETALLDERIDLAVHSMKDMPAIIPDGLCIGAVPKRENPKDVLISKHRRPFSLLPKGAVIGTSSLRRASQLKYARPNITIYPLRGNLDTRIKALEKSGPGEDAVLDAVVLAAAGVKRLGMEDSVTEYLDETLVLPAAGQGALCVEARTDDSELIDIITHMDDEDTRYAVSGERAFLSRLEGGCQVPIAAYGKVDRDRMTLTGLVADIKGSVVIKDRIEGPKQSAQNMGVTLAERILPQGAEEVLEELKASS